MLDKFLANTYWSEKKKTRVGKSSLRKMHREVINYNNLKKKI